MNMADEKKDAIKRLVYYKSNYKFNEK